MKSQLARPCTSLGLLASTLLLLAGGGTAAARQVAIQSPETVLGEAEIVALASIVKVSVRDSQCDLITELALRPERALRGQLPASLKQVRLVVHEHKRAAGCISVSQTVPPVAAARAVGAKLIVTIRYIEARKEHRAIASFALHERPRIEEILGRLPRRAAAPLPADRPAAQAAISPQRRDDVGWVDETLQQLERGADLAQLAARFGTAPRASGSFTEVTPHSPLFASVLLLDERHGGGARTQRVSVVFAAGQLPRVRAFEQRFGKSMPLPPMASSRGEHVTWTRIIYVGRRQLQRGRARIVLKLAGGPQARLVREVTVDDYFEK